MQEGTESTGSGDQETQGQDLIQDLDVEKDEVFEEIDKIPETPRESVVKALEELEQQGDGGSDEAPEPQKEVRPEPTKVQEAKKPEVQEDPFDPDFIPPERFRAEQKEVFKKLPPPLKKELSKLVKDQEAHFTKKNQEVSEQYRQNQALFELISPHRTEWAEKGFTMSQVVGELLATHQKLINPETKYAKFKQLAFDCGIDLQQLMQAPQQAQYQLPDISHHPQFRALQEQVKPVLSLYEQQQRAFESQAAEAVTQDIVRVANELDSNGYYRYPKLHEAEWRERVKPSVLALVRNVPNMSYGEAFKRIHVALEGQGNSSQPNQAGLLNNNNQNKTTPRPAVSVRGRSAPSGITASPEDISDEERRNPAISVRKAFEELQRGR